jgi:hypothetical protein
MERKGFRKMVWVMAFSVVAGLSGAAHADHETAERIRNDGDRAANRGDREGAREAQEHAREAEHADADRSRDVERDYNRGK